MYIYICIIGVFFALCIDWLPGASWRENQTQFFTPICKSLDQKKKKEVEEDIIDWLTN